MFSVGSVMAQCLKCIIIWGCDHAGWGGEEEDGENKNARAINVGASDNTMIAARKNGSTESLGQWNSVDLATTRANNESPSGILFELLLCLCLHFLPRIYQLFSNVLPTLFASA